MIQEKICPFCGTKQAPHVERCEHCGQWLPAPRNQFFTTEKIAKSETELTDSLPSVEHLGRLSKNTLVVFVNGEDEPIFLEDVQNIIFGRPIAEMETARTLDLTNYGAVALGVSRRHIQITYADGMFMVLDLGSTNGTSLNGRFLPPTYSHRLQPFDELFLGQLRLIVYFEVEPSLQEKTFFLTDSQALQTSSLTLHYLTSTIIPYIQALAEIQNTCREVRGQPPEDVKVLHIKPGKHPAQVKLSLQMIDQVVDVVRQWIGPWQRMRADSSLLTARSNDNDNILLQQLLDLVVEISDYLSLSSSESETLAFQEKLLAPIRYIALSGLELTLEKPPT